MPEKLKNLSSSIVKFMEDKFKLKKELEEKNKKLLFFNKSEKKEAMKALEDSPEPEDIYPEIEEESETKTLSSKICANTLNERIRELENSIEILRKEINRKEKLIREEIFAHLLNNYNEIKNISGGELFIKKLGPEENFKWYLNRFSEEEIVQ